jgi:hypothetical protein
MTDYYDGIDETEDGPVIDRIISGIHPIMAEQASERHQVSALAQGALFYAGKDMRAESITESVEQHPSSQDSTDHRLSEVATKIIHDYQAELYRMERYKKQIDSSVATRDVFIAVVRNMARLSVHDREEIARALGYDKDYFIAEPDVSEKNDVLPREPDWRERQANDDTLKQA